MASLSARPRRLMTPNERDWQRKSDSDMPTGYALPFTHIASPTSGPQILLSSSLNSHKSLNRNRRRALLRNLANSSAVAAALIILLVYMGAFDANLRLGSHIDRFTFQILANGDPKHREELVYTRPPDYWRFIANWKAPSYELMSNVPPSQRPCDKQGPLLFIGLFTTPQGAGRRQILRTLFKPDLNPHGYRIDFKFILGRPPDDDWRYLLEQENEMHDDIAILEDVFKDNIDEGKSIEYFRWAVKTLPDPKPQFIMKLDDDTFLVMPNVIRNFTTLDCARSVYWGTEQGAARDFFGPYMRGMGYALSWPLASWIGTANVSTEYATGTEDAKIGKMVSSLDPVKEPVQWVDQGWKMGDWDQLKVDENLIAFHWLKQDHWVPMVKRKAMKAFADVGREYRWDWDRNETIGV